MGTQVCSTAMMMCSFGTSPSPLTVLPAGQVLTQTPAATIMDQVPFMNIPMFGQCSSMLNPAVAAATAAALGAMTPMPCTPVAAGPWAPGAPTVMIGGKPALNESSKLNCAFGGVIQITFPGQVTVQIP